MSIKFNILHINLNTLNKSNKLLETKRPGKISKVKTFNFEEEKKFTIGGGGLHIVAEILCFTGVIYGSSFFYLLFSENNDIQ